ncbi:efflux transporter outer membrane subunit [Paraburkholderia phosphatilytica]|uniref:efflux transporter outer membrane subunit n=1 Tax=Paraburkholderia phosphatilytica TaxID=2282883 RepID=UPI001F0BEDE0|nr:efflux transporter outer membrane subunit [Paraburkholderia phosphatilytica]
MFGLALTACSTIPDTTPPQVTVPTHYANAPEAASGWKAGTPANGQPLGPWWTVFNDAELNTLEAKVDVSNQTVRKAVAQLQQARAMVDYQHAGFLPTITAGADAQRFRTSQNVVDRSLAGKTVPDYSMGLSASWEPDLFGRIRAANANAADTAQASAADLEAVRLSVTADLAKDYFDLRSLDNQKQLLDASVNAYAAALRLLQQQLKDGAIDASAIAQAQTQLESTRTRDADVDVSRAQLQHAIATLIGEPASTFTLPPAVVSFTVPAIPPGLPSELLQRRPDIAAAERRVAAANAQIGEAHAAFFPDLVLSASAGLESTFYAPWFTAPSLFWSIGPQLAGTLFDGGKREASLHAANAQYDGTVADYRQSVLVALQQVEDNLSALQTLATEAQSEARAVSAANLSLTLTTNRFNAGAVSYLDVVTAQTIALSNQLQAEDIGARRMDASVALLKALGGPWQDRASAG